MVGHKHQPKCLYQVPSSRSNKSIIQHILWFLTCHFLLANMKLSLLTLVGATGLASAHCMFQSIDLKTGATHTDQFKDTFTNLIVDGIKSGYYQYVRINNNHWSHQSVQDVNSTDMRCGGEMIFPTNASTKAVSAGTTVGFSVEGGLGHPGPLQFYMAQAPAGQNLSSWNGTGDVWFKIAGDPPKVNGSGLIWPQQRESYLLPNLYITLTNLDNFKSPQKSPSKSQNLSQQETTFFEPSKSLFTVLLRLAVHKSTFNAPSSPLMDLAKVFHRPRSHSQAPTRLLTLVS